LPTTREFFHARFRELGTPKRAAGEKAYLKSPLRFHGVCAADVALACREFLESRDGWSRLELRSVVDDLFETDYHELRSAGLGLLERKRALLASADLPWLIGLIRRSPGWAHVDWLATRVIGPVVTESPRRDPVLRRWAKDRDFWVRRTALLAQLRALRSGEGEFQLFDELATPMLAEREFFIRKAIGWVLREVSKVRPDLVFRYLRANRGEVSGLTLREGAKYLSRSQRASLGLSGTRRPVTVGARRSRK